MREGFIVGFLLLSVGVRDGPAIVLLIGACNVAGTSVGVGVGPILGAIVATATGIIVGTSVGLFVGLREPMRGNVYERNSCRIC